MKIQKFHLVGVILLALTFTSAHAQTSAFNYQGNLKVSGLAANGNFDFEFRLIDEFGTVIALQPSNNVAVANGVFNVALDFGIGAFPGPARSLEISVRPVGGPAFTTLLPRQPINSSPYAIKSLFSATADNSLKLGGVASTRFLQQDASGNVSIGGNLAVAGAATYGTVNVTTQYDLGGQRILGASGLGNLFAGVNSGQSNTTGNFNAFFGSGSGQSNTSGIFNAFFGSASGQANIDGYENSFFGASAGLKNTNGFFNSFFGAAAGSSNTLGNENSFFGSGAGRDNTTGSDNTFVGKNAGILTTSGISNTFVGAAAGTSNLTGFQNTFVGVRAGLNNTASDNAFFGFGAGEANTTGTANAFFGSHAGAANTTGATNSFFGNISGFSNTGGLRNTFLGFFSGAANANGSDNTFAGYNAGKSNVASNNSFFGSGAGENNTTGTQNAFFGISAGQATTTSCCNSFFGNAAGVSNTIGRSNAFFGGSAGANNVDGLGNSYLGDTAGWFVAAGSNNTFVGYRSGASLTAASGSTFLGENTLSAQNLVNANAIGRNAFVSASNSMVLGSINGTNGATADTNVGVGTTAPQTRFQVKTGAGNYGITHTDGAITVGSYVGSSLSGALGGWVGTQSNHKLFFFTNNGQPSMTVDTTGNVGVGTTAPASKFTVAGLIESTTGGVKFPDGTIQTTAGVGTAVTGLNGLTGNVSLAAGSNITITPAGNTLTIASSASAINAILNQTTPQAASNFNISGNGTVGGTLTANSAHVAGNGFVLGNFGIGTATPLAKLDVTGGNILIASAGNGVILRSPDGNTCRLLSVDDAGAFSLTPIACP